MPRRCNTSRWRRWQPKAKSWWAHRVVKLACAATSSRWTRRAALRLGVPSPPPRLASRVATRGPVTPTKTAAAASGSPALMTRRQIWPTGARATRRHGPPRGARVTTCTPPRQSRLTWTTGRSRATTNTTTTMHGTGTKSLPPC